MDLDNLTSLECSLRLFSVGFQWSVWSDICAWRNSGAVADTLGDLLALEDLGDFFLEEFVSLLADLNNLCALDTESCKAKSEK